jgi:geranylgeranyl diphosphate synthase type II
MFAQLFKAELELIERHLRSVLSEQIPAPHPSLLKFWECMNYSLLSEGKRFRPLLALLTARSLNKPMEQALPMAAAVELIHTYSLIHDDLPSMDNDDFRRGRPTNHKIYGEGQALLAGDGLLTLAFSALAESKSEGLRHALRLLAEAAGPCGMVGGQVMDIASENPDGHLLAEIHKRKTGALIRVSVEGTAALMHCLLEQQKELALYGEKLGLAFQLADDLQDFDPNKPEKVNFAARVGVAETKRLLATASQEALAALEKFDETAEGLRQMVRFNSERV